jgi:hypothetical protein
MFGGAALMVAALPGLAAAVQAFSLGRHVLAATWLSAGSGYSAILTPPGRLLRCAARPRIAPNRWRRNSRCRTPIGWRSIRRRAR